MRVLALDSTTRAGSVALVDVDAAGAARVIEARAGDPSRTHAERLPAELTAILDAHRMALSDVDLFAVASGPGSFTGLRIGIATMQGFALVCGRPLAGVSALDALAQSAVGHLDGPATIAAWMDAHRREVFTALYEIGRAGGAGRVREIEGPRVGSAADTLARWVGMQVQPSLFIGGGAVLYADTIGATLSSARVIEAPALAAAVGRIGGQRARSGALPHPAALQPLYVRRPDAELARDNTHRTAPLK